LRFCFAESNVLRHSGVNASRARNP
jgi:hypothetical protein